MEVVKERDRFVLKENDKILSWIIYEENDFVHLVETRYVESEKHASTLVKEVLKALEGRKVKISCSLVKEWIEKSKVVGDFEYTLLLRFKEEIEKFNRYRSPEANAELLEFDRRRAKVLFTGPFCVSCGIYDYFEDLTVDIGAKIESFDEFEDGFVVTYLFTEDLY